ncbi:4Fe-4S binding protein [bacterium]|nr:4Fe-4S binding protein [bacterium]
MFRGLSLIDAMNRLRLLSQIAFFILFLVLFLKTTYTGEAFINEQVRFFLEADPFLALVVLLETRGIPAGLTRLFVLSGIVLVMTAFLGRFFCGWVCPFGTLNHLAGYGPKLSKMKINRGVYSAYQKAKYGLLFVLLLLSLFALNFAGIFDPISLLIRSLTVAVFPWFHLVTEEVSTLFLNLDWPLITPVSEFFYQSLRHSFLPLSVQHFNQNLFIASLFVLILVLNRIRPRFWCRFICPYGALLGLCSSTSRVQRKVSQACNECNICHATCQGAPARIGAKDWNPQECLLCFNCTRVCPEKAVSFSWKKGKNQPLSKMLPDRRTFLLAAGASLISVPLFKGGPGRVLSNPHLIRPPGALPEPDFLARCIRCGECLKVCPTNGLQPTLLEAGLEGIWSPTFNMRLGYCEYSCTLCGQVCPTGAIQPLIETEKMQTKIGLAFIDVSRCLPYAFSVPCIVCEEHCPTPEKAIIFEEKEVRDLKGETLTLKFPRVVPDRCVGCGICENKCPVTDRRAIYVTSVNESRHEHNRLLLEDQGSAYPR